MFSYRKGWNRQNNLFKPICKENKQKHIIAAPGIAAINAGSVTFTVWNLPLTNFVPTVEYIDRNIAINIPQLISSFQIQKR